MVLRNADEDILVCRQKQIVRSDPLEKRHETTRAFEKDRNETVPPLTRA
jgi:RNase adaptor protein for sRNA GlmZ degradation